MAILEGALEGALVALGTSLLCNPRISYAHELFNRNDYILLNAARWIVWGLVVFLITRKRWSVVLFISYVVSATSFGTRTPVWLWWIHSGLAMVLAGVTARAIYTPTWTIRVLMSVAIFLPPLLRIYGWLFAVHLHIAWFIIMDNLIWAFALLRQALFPAPKKHRGWVLTCFIAFAIVAIAAGHVMIVSNISSLVTMDDAFSFVDTSGANSSFYTYLAHVTQTDAGFAQDVEEYKLLVDRITERDKSEGISLRIQQFSGNSTVQKILTTEVCVYAIERGVPCIISAYLSEYRSDELASFVHARQHITPASSHLLGLCITVDALDWDEQLRSMQTVVQASGFIRLVKGGWYGDATTEVKEWQRVTTRYAAAATVLGVNASAHLFATHDSYTVDLVRGHVDAEQFDKMRWIEFANNLPRRQSAASMGVFYGSLGSLDISFTNTILRFFHLRTNGIHVSTRSLMREIAHVRTILHD